MLIASGISYFTLKEVQLRGFEKDLKSNINLIELQLPFSWHPETLEAFARSIKQGIDKRVTLIGIDGAVLAETDREDISAMDNHRYRPEVIQALREPYGVNIRPSDSVDNDFLYVAKQVTYEGPPLIIRLAMNTAEIRQNFITIWLKVAVIFLVVLFFGFVISYMIHRRIALELSKLSHGLEAIANKEYKTRINAGFAREFTAIAETVHQLAEKLAKRDKQKRKHSAKLRLLSKQRSDIIAAVGHEFKNPIASIMGYAQTLLDDSAMDKAIQERFLGKIVTNGEKINTMVNRLSLATKLENGDLSPTLTQFDLAKLAGDVVASFKSRFSGRIFVAHLDATMVNADATMIEMVLNNLLDNAIKYSENRIYIEVRQGKCSITDEGAGISEEEIPKITKKFYRTNSHSWDNSIGLGLSLVNYVLKLHESELVIESELGQGSTFSFTL
jgi:signal transduction histidine kinase